MEYLLWLLPRLSKWGATAVLFEGEDALPWSEPFQQLQGPQAYSADQLNRFLCEARSCNLQVIPLIQTFGHLEFLLKHSSFASLRELSGNFMDLCPCNPDSVPTIIQLVDQVLELFPNSPAVHIGADEVFSLGSCEECALKEKEGGEDVLFLSHFLPIVNHVKSKGRRVLAWDDMFRSWTESQLSQLPEDLELVIWCYKPDIDAALPTDLWDKLPRQVSRLWGASAYKGAARAWTDFPPIATHLRNTVCWAARSKQTALQGLILTGWSRFTHLTVLCETLPVSIPSLALCLAVVRHLWGSRTVSEPGSSTCQIAMWMLHDPAVDLGLEVQLLLRSHEDLLSSLGRDGFINCRAVTDSAVESVPGMSIFRLHWHLQVARVVYQKARETMLTYMPEGYTGEGRHNAAIRAEVVTTLERAKHVVEAAASSAEQVLSSVLHPMDVEEVIRQVVSPLKRDIETQLQHVCDSCFRSDGHGLDMEIDSKHPTYSDMRKPTG
eukprot:GILJ01019676.1.p1 GENE.GILJ01019676.1~~GILJ01019676.1.p1  ORF type:complete len:538 (-),score=67.22 GILJ01019676.1:87-1568(-)